MAGTAAMARQQIGEDVVAEAPIPTESYPGLVRPHDVTTIALPIAVAVRAVHVTVGDHVQIGQPLMDFDADEARHQVKQLTMEAERARAQTAELGASLAIVDKSARELTVNLAKANAELAVAQRTLENLPTRQWKDSPERAQAAYDQAVAHEQRLADLVSHGVVARQELDDARIAVRVAADDLAIARRSADASARLVAIQAVQARVQSALAIADEHRRRAEQSGELTQARLRQAQAEDALATATSRLNEMGVRAPADALVAEVGVKAGDRPLAGVPLLKLATLDPMVVDVDVPPSIVNALRRGDRVAVRLSGSLDHRDGRILTIAPLPGDAGAHTVEVAFDNPSQTLLSGQLARVQFPVRR